VVGVVPQADLANCAAGSTGQEFSKEAIVNYSSLWQAHKASSCGAACWYCQHPITLSGWRVASRPTRIKLGKKATKALKRQKSKARRAKNIAEKMC
jgi:hypothetical protein